jgi:hypothetical protein
MFRVAFGEYWFDMSLAKRISMWLRVITTITLNTLRALARAAAFSTYGANSVDQRDQLSYVMGVGARQNDGQGDAVGVGDYMVLAATLAAIRGIRTGFLPPITAFKDALSTIARDQSIWSARCNSSSSRSCNLSQTPTFCQATNRRQHVMPDPQPISWGKSSQAMPVFSTNKMPVNASRLPTGGRPPLGDFFNRGKIDSQIFHNSSGNNCFAMTVPPCLKEKTAH